MTDLTQRHTAVIRVVKRTSAKFWSQAQHQHLTQLEIFHALELINATTIAAFVEGLSESQGLTPREFLTAFSTTFWSNVMAEVENLIADGPTNPPQSGEGGPAPRGPEQESE